MHTSQPLQPIDREASRELLDIHGSSEGRILAKLCPRALMEAELENHQQEVRAIADTLKPMELRLFGLLAEPWASRQASRWYANEQIFADNQSQTREPFQSIAYLKDDPPKESRIPRAIRKILRGVPERKTLREVADDSVEIAKLLSESEKPKSEEPGRSAVAGPRRGADTVRKILAAPPPTEEKQEEKVVPLVTNVKGTAPPGKTPIESLKGTLEIPSFELRRVLVPSNLGVKVTHQAWRLNVGYTKVFKKEILEAYPKTIPILTLVDLTYSPDLELCDHCFRNDAFRQLIFQIAKLIKDSKPDQVRPFVFSGHKQSTILKLSTNYYMDMCRTPTTSVPTDVEDFIRQNYPNGDVHVVLIYHAEARTSLLRKAAEAFHKLQHDGYTVTSISCGYGQRKLSTPNAVEIRDTREEAVLETLQEGFNRHLTPDV